MVLLPFKELIDEGSLLGVLREEMLRDGWLSIGEILEDSIALREFKVSINDEGDGLGWIDLLVFFSFGFSFKKVNGDFFMGDVSKSEEGLNGSGWLTDNVPIKSDTGFGCFHF